MHTGYDNFWMHKYSRLKPVLDLPKNDNYRCALLPDNYKHMQNGGCPNHLSTFVPYQSNVGSSHEKDHYRNSHDQSRWPSSVYSLPSMPSYANNLHPQEPFFTHTNNFVYSCPNPQAQEKNHFRHLEMSNGNVNILTVQNTNPSTLTNNGLAHAQNNKITNPQIPRIRVKDVFSLNNKSVQNQLGLDSHSGIRQQKELLGCAAHCNTALASQTQTEYIKYRNANLVESSKSTSHFEHRAANQACLNNQEKFQNSGSFYQQNDGYSMGNFEFSGGRQIESSWPLESFNSGTTASLLSQLLTQESILDRGLQNCRGNAGAQGNAQRGHGGEKATTIGNLVGLQNPDYSDSDYFRSRGLNEGAPDNSTNLRNVTNAHCNLQENLPKTNEVNLMSRNSASNTMAKNASSVTSKSPTLKEINNQQNCFRKINIPYIGKSSFVRLNDCDDTDRNSVTSFQSFFEQNDKNCATDRNSLNINDEENGVVNSLSPPVGQDSFISHRASLEAASIHDISANESDTITHKISVPAVSTSLISSPRNHQKDAINQRLHRQFDGVSNKDGDIIQNPTGAPEIFQQKFAVKTSLGDNDIVKQEIPNSDFTATLLTLKQESFHPEIESASLQNPPGGKEFHRPIKTEANSENLTVRECELQLQPPGVVNEALDKFHIEGCSSASKSRSDSAHVTDSEDHVDQVNILKSSSSQRGDVQKEKERGKEISLSKVNYISNINRDKLDSLIQFLKKDEYSSGSSSCKERQSCQRTSSSANNDSHRSRRKLSKASVVRNKNNSRELISLMAPKVSNFTCKAPQITEGSKNLEKTEDGKSGCSKDRENESKKNDSWVAESSNEATCVSKQQLQESSEKPVPKDKCGARDENAVISTLKAFQNSKTHICVSCNLVSSMESLWMNVVSGEVRCLNCFKRMTSKAKAKAHVLKSNSHDLDDSSVEPLRKRKRKTEKENKPKEDSVAVGGSDSCDEDGRKSECEGALQKLNGTEKNDIQELLNLFGSAKRKNNKRKETTNFSCRKRRSSSGEGVNSQKGRPSEEKVCETEKFARNRSSRKELAGRRLSENGTNHGVKNINTNRKRKSSSERKEFAKRERHSSSVKQGKTSTRLKEHYSEDGAKEEPVTKSEKLHGRRASRSEEGSENGAKKKKKRDDSSKIRRSSDDTGEEFRCHKVSVIEEHGQKDPKVRHCTDESRKPLPREDCPARKDHAAEEAAKRSVWHETSDNSKNQNIRREDRDCQRPKTSELFEWRDPSAADATPRSTSSQNAVGYQKGVESTVQPRKRENVGEDFSPRKVNIVQDFAKRDSARATLPSRSSEAKAPPEGLKARMRNLWKGLFASQRAKPTEPTKGKVTGFMEEPRWKSRDEHGSPQKTVDSRRASDSSEEPRRKSFEELRILTHFNGEEERKNLATESSKNKKWEEKEGSRSSEKMPKVSPAGLHVLSSSAKDGSRLFREKQGSKATAGEGEKCEKKENGSEVGHVPLGVL